METIFYYTGGITLIMLSIILSIWILMICLFLIKRLTFDIKNYSIFVYKISKMNGREKQISNDLHMSLIQGYKEALDKYFK